MTFRDGGRDVRFPERIIFEFFRLQQVRTESNIVFSIVPLIFSTAFPIFSFGTWNYIFQTLLVITLMVLKRSFCPGYLFSFVVVIRQVRSNVVLIRWYFLCSSSDRSRGKISVGTIGSMVTQALCTSIIFPNPIPTTKENR